MTQPTNEARADTTCKHGWRGTVPENGERIVTPCPSCGQRTLFIGTGGHLTCGNLGPDCKEPGVERQIDAMKVKAEKLQAFKNWVHVYLDTHGVPPHPPGVHGAEGCRIGDRMDWLMERLRKAEGDAPPGVGERMREKIANYIRHYPLSEDDCPVVQFLEDRITLGDLRALAGPAPAEGATEQTK